MTLILALDQSTSATKAILFDQVGTVIDSATRNHRQIYPQPGWVEHDAEEIWQNALTVIRDLRQRQSLDDVVALSIANQRETVVAFERDGGKPLRNAVVWQCRRGTSICEALRARGLDEVVRHRTGLRLDAYFSGSKLAWLIAHDPRVADRTRDGSAVIGTIDAYLVHRLTKGKTFATDHTNASRTLLFDVRSLRWDPDLCDAFSVPMSALPEVRESSARFGDTDIEGLLPKHVPIIGVMGDSQASLFAQRCFRPGDTKITFGTGTSVLMNIGDTFRLRENGGGGVTSLAWVRDGQATYAAEGIINSSAATLAWLKNRLGLIQDESEIEPLSLSVRDTGGVYLVPAFTGLSAPHVSTAARAAIVGMTTYTGREHVVRAALESIAYQVRDTLGMLIAETGIRPRFLQADGGPTKNALLMQFTADLTGVILNVSDNPSASAWGAALCGLLGLGEYTSLEDIARGARASHRFSPHMSTTEATYLHNGWLAAVARVL